MTEGGLPAEERVAECDKLFTGYLTVKDRASAAEVLVDIAHLWRGEDWGSAFAAANKCIKLFGDTADPNVATQVKEAFAFRFGDDVTTKDDPDFVPECVEYGKWLVRAPIDVSEATSIIMELDECIPREPWIEIAGAFLAARRDFLSRKDVGRVQITMMFRHEELEEFDAALDIGLGMLKEGFESPEERAETLRTLGTCFKGTKEYETAKMFLRQVIQMYPENSDDWVRKSAREALDEIDILKADLRMKEKPTSAP
jgi:hypothetical protein